MNQGNLETPTQLGISEFVQPFGRYADLSEPLSPLGPMLKRESEAAVTWPLKSSKRTRLMNISCRRTRKGEQLSCLYDSEILHGFQDIARKRYHSSLDLLLKSSMNPYDSIFGQYVGNLLKILNHIDTEVAKFHELYKKVYKLDTICI